MRVLTVRRELEKINRRSNYKVVISGGQKVDLGIGESKELLIAPTAVKAYVKLDSLKSKDIIIDPSTKELVLKGNRSKRRLISTIVVFSILLLLLPVIFGYLSKHVQIGYSAVLSLMFCYSLFAFVLKRKGWVVVEHKREE